MRASLTIQGLIASEYSYQNVVDRTGNRIKDDVENDQKDNESDSPALMLLLTDHNKASFRACFF